MIGASNRNTSLVSGANSVVGGTVTISSATWLVGSDIGSLEKDSEVLAFGSDAQEAKGANRHIPARTLSRRDLIWTCLNLNLSHRVWSRW